MARPLFLMCLAALVCGGRAADAAAPARQTVLPQPAAGRAVIVGRVVDQAGQPVGHARILLSGPAGWMTRIDGTSFFREFMTDEHGDFAVTGLPRGQYGIRAGKAGYAEGFYGRRIPEGRFGTLTLEDGERRLDVTVTLWKHAAVGGVVTDETGAPMRDAYVRVLRPGLRAGRSAFDGVSARGGPTDDRGEFRIFGLMPGEYLLVAASSQTIMLASETTDAAAPRRLVYQSACYPAQAGDGPLKLITIGPGQELASVRLQLVPVPAVRIEGRLEGDAELAGARAGEASVGLRLDSDNLLAKQMSGGRSGSVRPDGRFSIDGVPAGVYVVEARAMNWRRSDAPRGQEASIQTQSGSVGSVTPLSTSSAPPPEPDPNPRFGSTSVAVGSTDVTGVAVPMRVGARISGRIEIDGVPPTIAAEALRRRIQLAIEPAAGGWTAGLMTTIVSDGGRFSIAGFAPGRYVIRASDTSHQWGLTAVTWNGRDLSHAFDLDGAAIDDVVITFASRRTAIEGVAAGTGGRLESGTTVLAFPMNPRLWVDYGNASDRIRQVSTEEGGVYAVNLPHGDYYVVATTGEVAADWPHPDNLQRLTRTAERATLGEGQRLTLRLRAQPIR
jgi:hypothetical protein